MTAIDLGRFEEFIYLFYSCIACQVTVDSLQTKVSQMLKPNHSSVVSRGHLGEDHEGVLNHVFNLSIDVTKLSEDVHQHSRKLAELVHWLLLL